MSNLGQNHPIGEMNPPQRLMMTPGPASIDPRVYRALASLGLIRELRQVPAHVLDQGQIRKAA